MFGYITIHKDELKIKDYNRYHAYYCGLCRELSKRHGELSRLTLTYDMTFLVILLTGLYEPVTHQTQFRCPLHPVKKLPSLSNEFTQYAADMDVLLSYYNLKDDWSDEKKLSSLAMTKVLKSSCKKIIATYPVQGAALMQYMEKLLACERDNIKDLDTASGYTGEMLGRIFAIKEDEWAEGLYKLGFYMGKFIYLCDAWEDLNKDKKSGNYNPLIYYENNPNFTQMVEDILTMMAAACAREFECLPVLTDAAILRNILYSGIWARYEGTKIKLQNGEEHGKKL